MIGSDRQRRCREKVHAVSEAGGQDPEQPRGPRDDSNEPEQRVRANKRSRESAVISPGGIGEKRREGGGAQGYPPGAEHALDVLTFCRRRGRRDAGQPRPSLQEKRRRTELAKHIARGPGESDH